MGRRARDGSTWRIGTDADIGWITEDTAYDRGLPTSMSRTITGAIPPVFEAYATVVVAYGEERVKHDRAVLGLVADQSPDQRWWLGYLDTGVDDIVFPDAPKVILYAAGITCWSRPGRNRPRPGAQVTAGRSGLVTCRT